jgi:hypothetical protein
MKGDYADILNDLRKYPIDEVKTSYKSKIKAVKSSVESLPITIQTLQTSLPDIQGLDDVKKEIEETKKQIADIDAQITGSSEFFKSYCFHNYFISLINAFPQVILSLSSSFEGTNTMTSHPSSSSGCSNLRYTS